MSIYATIHSSAYRHGSAAYASVHADANDHRHADRPRGAIAFLLNDWFGRMMGVAVAVAVSASFLGAYVSFFIDSAPAPKIVLLITLAFIATFLSRRTRGARERAAEPTS